MTDITWIEIADFLAIALFFGFFIYFIQSNASGDDILGRMTAVDVEVKIEHMLRMEGYVEKTVKIDKRFDVEVRGSEVLVGLRSKNKVSKFFDAVFDRPGMRVYSRSFLDHRDQQVKIKKIKEGEYLLSKTSVT